MQLTSNVRSPDQPELRAVDEKEIEALKAELRGIESKAVTDIPRHRLYLRELCDVSRRTVRSFSIPETDNLGFMSVHFFEKQLGHASAIQILDGHRDTALVARSMLEGLCFLKWASHDSQRSLRWRLFTVIQEWRELRAGMAAKSIDHDARELELHTYLSEHHDAILSSRALQARQRGKALPADPYISTWYSAKLIDIFALVKAEELYAGPYGFASDWHHWSSAGLALAMEYEGYSLEYVRSSPVFQATAYANAFQCLAETSLFLVHHFELDGREPLEAVINRYVDELGSPERG